MTALRTAAAVASTFLTALAVTSNKDASDKHVELPQEAVVVLSPTNGNHTTGTLLLQQKEGGVHITGTVSGIEPGEHGFHIHQFGDLRGAQGKLAGGHYNPQGGKHGSPDSSEHHAGDLGNIAADTRGVATVDKMAKDLKLHLVIGRSIVVHGGVDDLKSQPSGAAGPRIGLGVIGLSEIQPKKTNESPR